MAFVEIQNLWVTYGKTIAVRDLSFGIPQGDVFGFIGPNGAGKTTTIKVLATLIKPAFGRALIDGTDVVRNPTAIRKRIGYVPDFFGVYDDLTVREYLHFFAAAYRISPRQRRGTVEDVLALTDLAGKRDAPVEGLSRGMKQRLSIARVLLHDPAVLLMDEPASGLDPRARIEIRELLKELKRMGKTILVSSHILHELSQLCTRIGIVEQGQLVAEGALSDIYQQLGLKQVIHVQVTNLTQTLLDRMKGLPGVSAIEQFVDQLSLQIRPEDTTTEDLLASLHNIGARIHMFQPEAMDMETVFMKLTEGKTA